MKRHYQVLCGLILATAARGDLDDGLLLYYNFNQNEGTQVTDQSGHNRHARVEGPQWVAEGIGGGAYHFIHEGDTITTSDEGLPMGDAPRTLSWWFSLDQLRPAQHSTEMISYGTLAHTKFFVASIDWRVGRDCPILSPWGWVYISRYKIERANQWHHAVLQYAGNGKFTYIIDGHICKGHNECPRPIDTQLGGSFRLGHFDGGAHTLDGHIDEVRLYDRVLNADELKALFIEGAALVNQPLVAESGQIGEHPKQQAVPSGQGTITGASPVLNLHAEGIPSSTPDHPQVESMTTSADRYQMTRIGFSTEEDGERDVSIFYLNETLHVWVEDVDLDAMDTNIVVKVSIYQQSNHEGQADLSVQLTPRPEGDFKATLSLNTLKAGRALIDIAGYDMEGRVLRLFRTAPITLRGPEP